MKILLLAVIIAWVIALILPVVLKMFRSKKGDNGEKK